MSTETIDQVIDNATIAPEPVEATTEEVTEAVSEPAEAAKVEDTPFPKKAINALSRRDKQIGKLRAELAHFQAELARYKQPEAKPQSNRPNQDEFESYGDYLKAEMKYELQQELAKQNEQTQQSRQKLEEQTYQVQWKQEREDHVAQQAADVVKSYPKLAELVHEYSDVLDAFPPHIEQVWLEANNAPYALIALATEGKLEGLAYMSPTQAAMEIARAEVRGEQIAKSKPITKAPAPIDSARGSGTGAKALDDMTWEELKKWQRS